MAFALNNMSLDERFAALDDEKARFVSKVYSGLTLSLAVAAVSCGISIALFNKMPPQEVRGIFTIMCIVELVMIVGSMFIRMTGPFGWAFLLSFVTVTGVTLAPVLMIYARPPADAPMSNSGTATIAAALGLTATIFLTLTAYVRWSGKDFSYLGGFLWMATIGLIVTGIGLMFFNYETVNYIRACIGALIFCGWILFDTSAVTRQYYRDNNVVGAVLTLYLDILNLFMFLLQILGNRRRD